MPPKVPEVSPSSYRSQYFKLSRSSVRYYRLMALAEEIGCSWQDLVREAIDQYLKSCSKPSDYLRKV